MKAVIPSWVHALVASVSMSAMTVAMQGHAQAQTAPNWAGFYTGIYGGIARGRSDFKTNAPCGPDNVIGYFCEVGNPGSFAAGAEISGAGSGASTSTRFTGGVQAGYNWQFGKIVAGIETDFGAFDLQTSRTMRSPFTNNGSNVGPGTTYNISTNAAADWLYTLRGRLGTTVSNTLLYATGGLAVSRLSVSNFYFDDNGTPNTAFGGAGSSRNNLGFALGAGIECAFTKNWTAKFEYLHVDLGSVTANAVLRGPPAAYAQGLNTKVDVTADVVRLGINYKY